MTTIIFMFSIPQLFVEGGSAGMSVVTLFLIAMLFAVWKAPNWVKELGLAAMMAGIMWTLFGLFTASDDIIKAGDIAPTILAGGLRVALISAIYGIIVYLISVIIRIIQSPRK